jgi:hypothetical protein
MSADLYAIDRPAWAEGQAQALRDLPPGASGRLDVPHLIEELEDFVADAKGRVVSLAALIMEHRLYLDHSPAQDPRLHQEAEIERFRVQLEAVLTATLRQHLEVNLDRAYAGARRVAQKKLLAYHEVEASKRLPATRAYSLDDVLGGGVAGQAAVVRPAAGPSATPYALEDPWRDGWYPMRRERAEAPFG